MSRPKNTPIQEEAQKIIQVNLNELIMKWGMSQVELARLTGIPTTTINGYVKGTSLPTPGNVEKLSRLFNVPKEEIDPRFKSDAFKDFNINLHKEKLSQQEGKFFEQLIEKTLSLTESEREDFLKNVRIAVKFFDENR